eukprot:1159796-Pelagomonas_calceolata.AAC.2
MAHWSSRHLASPRGVPLTLHPPRFITRRQILRAHNDSQGRSEMAPTVLGSSWVYFWHIVCNKMCGELTVLFDEQSTRKCCCVRLLGNTQKAQSNVKGGMYIEPYPQPLG